MAFPTIPTVASGDLLSSTTSPASTTHTFPNLSSLRGGAGPQAGDLIIAICVQYQGGTANAEFSSWGASLTEILDDALGSGTGNGANGVAYKVASGSESGTFTVTSAHSFKSVNFLMRIPVGTWHGTNIPEVLGSTRAAGAVANPGALNPANWGTEDTLWIAVGAHTETTTTGSPPVITAAPTNFTGELIVARVADAVGDITAGVAFRQLNAASEDVGTWTVSNATRGNHIATVIAICPDLPVPKSGTDSGSGSDSSSVVYSIAGTDSGGVPQGETSSGPASPTAATNVAAGGNDWNNPASVEANDGNIADVFGMASNYLYASGFGFAIPGGASIVGVEVVANDFNGGNISGAYLTATGAGNDKSDRQPLTSVGGNQTLGGPTDLWNYGASLTPGNVNGSSFGVHILSADDTAAGVGEIDYVSVKVYYTTGAGGESAVTASDSSDKAGTDSGAGAEGTSTLVVALPTSESSSGTEASALAAAIAATEDTGSGSDSSTLVVTLSTTDSGSGADASDVPVKAAEDAGSGTESSTLVVDLPRTDSDVADHPWYTAGTVFEATGEGGTGWTNATVAALSADDANAASVTIGIGQGYSNTLVLHNLGYTVPQGRVTALEVELVGSISGVATLDLHVVKTVADPNFTVWSALNRWWDGPLASGTWTKGDKYDNWRTLQRLLFTPETADLEASTFGIAIQLTGAPGDSVTIERFRIRPHIGVDQGHQDPATPDTGSGTEGTAVITVPVAGTDTGAGDEVSALAADLAAVDSGASSDASTLVTSVAGTDTGSGADAGAFDAASYALTDEGTGADTAAVSTAVLSATDTGTDDEVSALIADYAATDSGSGTESSALVVDLSASDSAAGSEASSLLTEDPNKTASDTGSGAEASALTVDLPLTDTAAGSEVSTLTAVYATTDSGAGTEASLLDQAYLASDTGSGVEEAVVLVTDLAATDTGTDTEASALVTDLAATDSGTDSEASDVFTGALDVAAADTGAGTDIVGEFARVLHERGRAQVQKFGYGSYQANPQRGWWTPGGNADWSGIGLSETDDYPVAWQADFPYTTYKATVTVPAGGVTDNASATYFPGLYFNWDDSLDYASPADYPLYLAFDFRTVAAQSGCTIEAQLLLDGVPFGNFLTKPIPAGSNTITLEGDVNGSGWYVSPVWASTSQGIVDGGKLASPRFGVRFYLWSAAGTDTVIDITEISLNTTVGTPPFSAGGVGSVQEIGALQFAASDTGTGADASSALDASLSATDDGSGSDASSPLEIGAVTTDSGVGSDSAVVAIVVTASDSGSGADVVVLVAEFALTDVGSATELISGLGLASSDTGTGTESLGARIFGATELLEVLDSANANWYLDPLASDNVLALTATSPYTETLTASTAGTQTLTAPTAQTETLTVASSDSQGLSPIDYEPQ